MNNSQLPKNHGGSKKWKVIELLIFQNEMNFVTYKVIKVLSICMYSNYVNFFNQWKRPNYNMNDSIHKENALILKSFCEKQILIFLSAKLLCFFEYNYRKSVNSTKLDKEDSSVFLLLLIFYLETLAQCKSSIHPIFSTEHFQN